MKNRQFIILCILVIVGFSILYIQNDKIEYNISTYIEWRSLWSVELIQDKIDTTAEWILKAIYWLD